MNLKENWWRYIVLIIAVVGLVWWRQRGAEVTNEAKLSEQLELNGRVDDFLESTGISLPEDGERANMRDVSGGVATGVATRHEVDEGTSVTVIAALDESPAGWYEAWLVAEDRAISMGRMKEAKGGWLVDFVTAEDVVDFSKVQISAESRAGDAPTEVVLEGRF